MYATRLPSGLILKDPSINEERSSWAMRVSETVVSGVFSGAAAGALVQRRKVRDRSISFLDILPACFCEHLL